MWTTRNIIVAAIAGIAGCIANSIAITAVVGAPLMPLIFSPGREFFSVVFAMSLIPIFAKMGGAAAWVTAFVVLEALSSLSAKLVFGAEAPWSLVLFFNGVYAIVAIVVYVFGAKPVRVRACAVGRGRGTAPPAAPAGGAVRLKRRPASHTIGVPTSRDVVDPEHDLPMSRTGEQPARFVHGDDGISCVTLLGVFANREEAHRFLGAPLSRGRAGNCRIDGRRA